MKDAEVKTKVREAYARSAKGESGCSTDQSSCCSPSQTAADMSSTIGYSADEQGSVPEGSDLGLGCGNPTALASLAEGETVLDLGSGAGFDCFLAAKKVGKSGQVIGVDMTPEMLDKARSNAEKGGYTNVEFRLGEIEHLPLADATVDVIISNCVINLAPDKGRVFAEALRVLKPGGRIMVSDIVLNQELPEAVKKSVTAYVGCVAGADLKATYLAHIEKAGFADVEIHSAKTFSEETVLEYLKGSGSDTRSDGFESLYATAAKAVESITVSAVKPR